jgi:hypothetical protein
MTFPHSTTATPSIPDLRAEFDGHSSRPNTTDSLFAHVAGRFGRVEPRRRARASCPCRRCLTILTGRGFVGQRCAAGYVDRR